MPTPAFVERLKGAMARTRGGLQASIREAFGRGPVTSEGFWEGLEEGLIAADCGAEVSVQLVEELRASTRGKPLDEAGVIAALEDFVAERVAGEPSPLESDQRYTVIVAGVNGSGKTTTIAKLAQRDTAAGRSVLLGAADTFRAAAADQLGIWAERAGVEMISGKRGADPAAVAFDAIAAANARRTDRLFIDTAGRLHTQGKLMEELKKLGRVAARESRAPVLTLLVLDATTGQNGIVQAKLFQEALQVDGLVLTKLDGTAKGGTALAIVNGLGIPVWYVGIGEGAADMDVFDARAFASSLLG
jgi:fused signal recognition particle receptor